MAEYLRIIRAPGLHTYRAAGRSASQYRALAAERMLTMPVLGLSAGHGSIRDTAVALRPFGTDVVGETIAHCDHFQPEGQPEAVADALLRFFSRSQANV